MSVEIESQGLRIDGELYEIYCGSVQPWRLEPQEWPRILDHIIELGFGMIETYVPWSVHELSRGNCDFSGSRDIGRFLDLANERNLKVILRPGPHANAEITGFGYPERILLDEDLFARGPEGNPVWVPVPPRMFPSPTYAGDALYDEFAKYLDELAPILRQRLHPDGPIVALQADNEMSFFFRTAAFDCDYSSPAIEEYHFYLQEKYGSPAKVSEAYAIDVEDIDTVEPPRSFEASTARELPRYLDWAAFKERLMRRGVSRVAELFSKNGLGQVPITHNYPLGHLRSPFDLPGLEEEVDLVGMDMYYGSTDYEVLKSRCLALCGSSRLPWAPEFGCGGMHAWPPQGPDDLEFTFLSACMHGLMGFNFYMLVDRERWYGAPVRRDASLDPVRSSLVAGLLALAKKRAGSVRKADTLIASTRLYGRLENLSNVFDPLSPMALGGLGLYASAWCGKTELGLKHSAGFNTAVLHESLFSACSAARLAFNLGEAERPAGNLSRYKLCILPTLEIMERDVMVALVDYVKKGGTLVIGPDIPRFDETGKAEEYLSRFLSGKPERVPRLRQTGLHKLGEGRIILMPRMLELVEDEETLRWSMALFGRLAGCQAYPDPADPEIDVSLHTGASEYLWLANPTKEERFAAIADSGIGSLKDQWRQEVFTGKRVFSVPMPPYSVRPLQVMR